MKFLVCEGLWQDRLQVVITGKIGAGENGAGDGGKQETEEAHQVHEQEDVAGQGLTLNPFFIFPFRVALALACRFSFFGNKLRPYK